MNYLKNSLYTNIRFSVEQNQFNLHLGDTGKASDLILDVIKRPTYYRLSLNQTRKMFQCASSYKI